MNIAGQKAWGLLIAHREDKAIAARVVQQLGNPQIALATYERPAVALALSSHRERRDGTTVILEAQIVLALIADGAQSDDWYEWSITRARKLGKPTCGIALQGAKASTPLLFKYLGIAVLPLTETLSMDEILRASSEKT